MKRGILILMKRDARKLRPGEQEVVRQDAIRLVYEEGYSMSAAARVLNVSRRHAAKWCRLYEKGGWEALKSRKRGRRPGTGARLLPWQCALIARTIKDHTPDQLKMPFVLWPRAAIRDWIQLKFGILLPFPTLGDYLRKWGMTPQKPLRKACRQDSGKVGRWVAEEYPAIAERAQKEGGSIHWVDETGFTNKVNNPRGYAPRGQTPVPREDGRKFRINMISGVTNKGEPGFMCYEGTMNQSLYIKFLKRLVASSKRKVYVIADNLVGS